MSQLTIYLEEDALKRIRRMARGEKRSVSEWARERMLSGAAPGWPPGYFELLGAVKDDTLERPPQGRFDADAARGRL
jgi:hypothetical protein